MYSPFVPNRTSPFIPELALNSPYFVEGALALTNLATDIHALNVTAGWWTDIKTGNPLDRNVGELLALVHSEVSEALEGHRTNADDKHMPHYKNFDVELVDAVIRILDIAGARGVDFGRIFFEKLVYNRTRADHKIENRVLPGGKAC